MLKVSNCKKVFSTNLYIKKIFSNKRLTKWKKEEMKTICKYLIFICLYMADIKTYIFAAKSKFFVRE